MCNTKTALHLEETSKKRLGSSACSACAVAVQHGQACSMSTPSPRYSFLSGHCSLCTRFPRSEYCRLASQRTVTEWCHSQTRSWFHSTSADQMLLSVYAPDDKLLLQEAVVRMLTAIIQANLRLDLIVVARSRCRWEWGLHCNMKKKTTGKYYIKWGYHRCRNERS
jgi:hypothetical protein